MSSEMKNAPLQASATSKLPTGIVTARPNAYNLVNPNMIDRKEGFNPRFDFGEIEELAKSIYVQATQHKVPGGLLMPLRVQRKGDRFELIDGDRRLTAVELLLTRVALNKEISYAFDEGVPAYIVNANQDEETNLLQMFEANTSKPFSPLEEAAAYKQFLDLGWSRSDICKKVGRSSMHVNSTLLLLDADVSLQDAVKRGEVSASTAKEIARAAKGDKGEQVDLLATAKASKGKGDTAKTAKGQLKSKLQAKKEAKAAKKGKTLKMRALTDEQLSELGARLAKHLATLLKDAKLGEDISQGDLKEWAAKDDKLAVAYTAGVVDALKAAAGLKIALEV